MAFRKAASGLQSSWMFDRLPEEQLMTEPYRFNVVLVWSFQKFVDLLKKSSMSIHIVCKPHSFSRLTVPDGMEFYSEYSTPNVIPLYTCSHHDKCQTPGECSSKLQAGNETCPHLLPVQACKIKSVNVGVKWLTESFQLSGDIFRLHLTVQELEANTAVRMCSLRAIIWVVTHRFHLTVQELEVKTAESNITHWELSFEWSHL